MHVSVTTTTEGTQICLHLAPSETLPGVVSSVRQLLESRILGPVDRSLRPLRDLSEGQPDQLPALPEGVVSSVPPSVEGEAPLALLVRGPSTRLKIGQIPPHTALLIALDQAIAEANPPFLGIIGKVSAALSNLLPGEGPTLSRRIARASGQEFSEVHLRMSLPLLELPIVGRRLTKAIWRDLDVEARAGQFEEIQRTVALANRGIVATELAIKSLRKDPEPGVRQGAPVRLLRELTLIRNRAVVAEANARRVVEGR